MPVAPFKVGDQFVFVDVDLGFQSAMALKCVSDSLVLRKMCV
jgi:hypothetical protein